MDRRISSADRGAGNDDLEPDESVAAALARCGFRPRRWTRITPFRAVTEMRVAYRVELDDGRLIKARRCADEARACQVWEIRRHLSLDGFARIYARDGPVLVEEWVEGTPLPRAGGTPAHVLEAATILGRLHGVERIGDVVARSRTTTAERLEQAERDLGSIAEGHAPPPSWIRVLRSAMRRFDPGVAVTGVIHRDFCAENMVSGHDGRISLIDNEWLTVGPLAFDLGRVWCRWPMPRAAWALFLEAYTAQTAEPPPDSSLVFWQIVGTARSAALRLASDPGRLQEPLARLRELAEALEAPG